MAAKAVKLALSKSIHAPDGIARIPFYYETIRDLSCDESPSEYH